MIHNPFFSVIVPVFNKEKHIRNTINSVVKQTFTNFELLLINDGSTDKSVEEIEKVSDERIIIIHQENCGVSIARNKGIRNAKGLFIAFLDADDEWLPEKLDYQYHLHVKNPKIVWSFTGYRIIGELIQKENNYSQKGVLNDAIDALMDNLSIWTSTVVIRKDVFANNRLLFNDKISRSEDTELWYKMACIYPNVGVCNKTLAIYHKNEHSLSNTVVESLDFSFLSLGDRLQNELACIDELRKEKLLTKINKYYKDRMIEIWYSSNEFSKFKNTFSSYFDRKILNLMIFSNKFPKILKKIILKIIYESKRIF